MQSPSSAVRKKFYLIFSLGKLSLAAWAWVQERYLVTRLDGGPVASHRMIFGTLKLFFNCTPDQNVNSALISVFLALCGGNFKSVNSVWLFVIISGNTKPAGVADQEKRKTPHVPSYPANFATLSKYYHIKDFSLVYMFDCLSVCLFVVWTLYAHV